MIIDLNNVSPFYAAYASQANIINAALEKAIEESANKMGDSILELYAIQPSEEKMAA